MLLTRVKGLRPLRGGCAALDTRSAAWCFIDRRWREDGLTGGGRKDGYPFKPALRSGNAHEIPVSLRVSKPERRELMRLVSMIRKALKVKDHRIVKVERESEGLIVQIEVKKRRHLPCSHCGSRAPIRSRLPQRRWKYLPILGIPVTLVYRPARVQCPTCGVKVEAIPWSMGKSPVSRALVRALASWARDLSWSKVAQHFNVSWATVSQAVEAAVTFGMDQRALEHVRYIGIDEISRKRGHHYVTCVYDLDTKILLWAGENRTKETMHAFFDQFGEENTRRISGVCCDMWGPYATVVQERAPQAILVFDKFHIIKHLSEAVDKVRREELRTLNEEEKKALRGTRYIWLKNDENLSAQQRVRLSDLVKQNLKTVKAYLLKNLFQKLWKYRSKRWAKWFLDRWFWWATHSRIKPLRDFAWLLRRHEKGILAYFDMGLTNATVEGLNNKAKKVSHRAYGFSTPHTYIINLYHCLGGMPLPEPCTNS